MRHGKHTFKIGRTSSHRRCMMANMKKSLVLHGRVETTVRKGKELKREADKLITIAKKGGLSATRRASAELMVTYNKLNSKEAREAKGGNTTSYNGDRQVIKKLFEVSERNKERNGGYTRLIRTSNRVGDNAERCIVEFL